MTLSPRALVTLGLGYPPAVDARLGLWPADVQAPALAPALTGGHGRLGVRRAARRLPDPLPDLEEPAPLTVARAPLPEPLTPASPRRRSRATREAEWLWLGPP